MRMDYQQPQRRVGRNIEGMSLVELDKFKAALELCIEELNFNNPEMIQKLAEVNQALSKSKKTLH